ncbi:DNA topoisomerase I [Thermosipho melanesiensis]|uniref:DNA topoisomerase 1 n=2 Tax=Thermosipho melanesiensis TaxID=46541 RepID=A6LLT4_THEM4|nr:type I DNA topoisomerase [Thermosipho melanesiensis]ABR30885.1 DNA topoisomerase I [Thermosipho melanesiensis BI429]APT74004.1 DNA topoisomerase I [Thermosipho melanesiensis]OOC35933.1 DNA topoisomerase I [Thermosipho melanesiensis]OOC38435.1 DNA topoisomerase I [Thermosipho melanesiensis]OOC38896.1 DNA topoisomerase I [Thermosipho melanesiensis]
MEKKKKVIIVESPAKAKTIEKILGKNFKVISSKGHVRDLPPKKFGVDLKTFEPEFEIIPGKEKVIEKIKKETEGKEVLIASDMDREGEAIAWHLSNILNLSGKNRIIFTEITPNTIKKSVENPREIDIKKVNAQLARRILDRIVGYKISPLLWKIIKGAMSAGRVQSAALKIICDRERKRFLFKPKEFYKVSIEIKKVKANLWGISGKKIKQENITEEIANDIKETVKEVILEKISEKERKKSSPLPYITSTLQQDAATKLGFPVSKTMQIAQALYEGVDTKEGHIAFITYMRTDSTRVSEEAKEMAKAFIEKKFGENYLGTTKKGKKKKKNVQDAHECIRPVNVEITPEIAQDLLNKDMYKLYKIIWKRFVASQMKEATYKDKTYIFKSGKYEFRTTISHRIFDGFEIIYPEKETTEKAVQLNEGEKYKVSKINVEKDATKPPSRFTEATLVKTLEAEGIGRPSTYATIISTLLQRKYVVKEKKELVPTLLGFVVEDFLTKKFPEIVDKKFTALMEEELDKIEEGEKKWKEVLNEFYSKFSKDLLNAQKEFYTINYETDLKCEECENTYKLKIGKYGLYLNCESCGKNKSIDNTLNAVIIKNNAYIQKAIEKNIKETVSENSCPKCGGHLTRKKGKFGYYFKCDNCDFTVSGYKIAAGRCPKCSSVVVMKRSKNNKIYWACSNPDCDYMSWNEPK